VNSTHGRRVGSTLALTATHAALFFAALAAALIVNSTYAAPEAGWIGSTAITEMNRADLPHNVPTWTPALAREFPGCSARNALADVVVIKQDGTAVRMSFDAAWQRSHDDEPANDVWRVGACK